MRRFQSLIEPTTQPKAPIASGLILFFPLIGTLMGLERQRASK